MEIRSKDLLSYSRSCCTHLTINITSDSSEHQSVLGILSRYEFCFSKSHKASYTSIHSSSSERQWPLIRLPPPVTRWVFNFRCMTAYSETASFISWWNFNSHPSLIIRLKQCRPFSAWHVCLQSNLIIMNWKMSCNNIHVTGWPRLSEIKHINGIHWGRWLESVTVPA